MASNSTISVTFRLQTNGAETSMRDMAASVDRLQDAINGTLSPAEQLRTSLINWNQVTQALQGVTQSVSAISSTVSDLSGAYAVQEEVETKLATAMRNTMGATDEEIQSIKDLCSAQQELGVIGDEVQLAGAQELATYLELKSSLETLIPVMNDMVAQQYGIGASAESTAQIATMLGKVMNGQVNALSRYGYKFDEAQAHILKFGTESERAAVLAQVVGESVGGMNQALAQTDSGRMAQLANALGDVKEQLGGVVRHAAPYVALTSQILGSVNAVASLRSSVLALVPSLAQARNHVNILGVSIRTTTTAARVLAVTLKGLVVGSAIFAGISLLTWMIGELTGKTRELAGASGEAAEKQRTLADVAHDAAIRATEQNLKLQGLLATLNDSNAPMRERISAQKELNEAVRGFNARLDETGRKFKYNQAALDEYLKSLKAAYELEGAKEMLADLGKDKARLIIQREEAVKSEQQERDRRRSNDPFGDNSRLDKVPMLQTTVVSMLDHSIEELDRKAETVVNHINDLQQGIKSSPVTPEIPTPKGGGTVERMQTRYEELTRLIRDTTAAIGDMTEEEAAQARSNVAAWTRELQAIELRQAALMRPEALNTLRDYDEEIAYQTALLASASLDEARGIQRTIDALREKRAALVEIEEELPRQITTFGEIDRAIEVYTSLLNKATTAAQRLNAATMIRALEEQRERWQTSAGMKKPEGTGDEVRETLEERVKDLTNRVDDREGILTIRTVGLEEAAAALTEINRLKDQFGEKMSTEQLTALDRAADKYRELGRAAAGSFSTMQSGWSAVRGIGSGITNITRSLTESGNAWQRISGLVDGALTVMQGISVVVSLIKALTAVTQAAVPTQVASAVAESAVAREETAAYAGLAAAKTFAAHAAIPFAGTGIASGMIATQQATIIASAIPKFADGGIIYGPTLGLMGEYAGASTNPEVVAPLSKLRDLIGTAEAGGSVAAGPIELRIKGRDLVAVLANETRVGAASGRRTGIKI